MSLFNRKQPDQQIAAKLQLQPGDIIISEIPFQDAHRQDFVNFSNFSPGHSSVWAGDHLTKPFARSLQEIYIAPGLQLTNVWEGRHAVFRYADGEIAKLFAKIMENWASGNSEPIFVKKTYEYHIGNSLFIFQDQEYELTHEGIVLAICFSALREFLGEPHYKKGQRCTAMLTAAFQASLLASIVKSDKEKDYFGKMKQHTIHSLLEEVSHAGWKNTDLGKKLLLALEDSDFKELFPIPFCLDSHLATPKFLYEKLNSSPEFLTVGFFSYFDDEIVAVEKKKLT